MEGTHLITYNACALDIMTSLSEKWCIPVEDLHDLNSSNSAYQVLINTTTGLLSDSTRRVNIIYCWTRSPDKFISFDNIVLGLKIRKDLLTLVFTTVKSLTNVLTI